MTRGRFFFALASLLLLPAGAQATCIYSCTGVAVQQDCSLAPLATDPCGDGTLDCEPWARDVTFSWPRNEPLLIAALCLEECWAGPDNYDVSETEALTDWLGLYEPESGTPPTEGDFRLTELRCQDRRVYEHVGPQPSGERWVTLPEGMETDYTGQEFGARLVGVEFSGSGGGGGGGNATVNCAGGGGSLSLLPLLLLSGLRMRRV